MSLAEILSLFSSIAAAVAAVVAYLGREAVSALQKQRESDLRRLEESHRAELARQMENFKRTLTFFGAVDTELRGLRINSYSDLWRRTSELPRWPKDDLATYAKLGKFSASLRDWYFGEPNTTPGGMLLTPDAQLAYTNLQTKIAEVMEDKDPAQKLGDDYDVIRHLSSSLRTELTKDLLSRRETPEMLPNLRSS